MHRLLVLALACGLVGCIEFDEERYEEDYGGGAHYSYEFAVHDPKTGDVHSQKEERKGGSTQGEYSILESDGSKRTVQYTVHGKAGYSPLGDHGETSNKPTVQSYYKSGPSYENPSSQKSGGFLESLPTFKGYKPSYESGYKAPQPSYESSYKAPQPSYESGYKAPQPSYESSYKAPQPSYESSYKAPQPSYESSYKAPQPSYESSYQGPKSSYSFSYTKGNQKSNSPSYEAPPSSYKPSNYQIPLHIFNPKYKAPENRPFVPIIEEGNKPVVPASVFTPALVTYQPTQRAGYMPFPSNQSAYQPPVSNYLAAVPSYRPAPAGYKSPVPSFKAPSPSYQPEGPSFESSYKAAAPSYEPEFHNFESSYKATAPSYKSASPSYESSYKAAAPSYKPNYGEGTATSSVSFSTKGAVVKTSTKHIIPPKKHY